jgi:transcriptional regulator with XRE-family HTH domain
MELNYLYRDSMSRPSAAENLVIDWKTVGRRIRELRGFDTNQSQLAEAIGVAQSHISAVERGQKEIGALLLFRIARYYGRTMEWLLTGDDPKTD